MFRGLFIGIDDYTAPVRRLSCAARDAAALSALFHDSLGGDVKLLSDGDATRGNMVAALAELENAEHDDLVVVTFSGHGTPHHSLVPIDVDPDDNASMLDLDELAALLDQVPAKRLFVVLDCCFSGGFGGERAFAPGTARNMIEDRAKLTALGHGRVVLTACAAGEFAHETIQLGHGLLTNYLLTALQGPPELGHKPQLPLPEFLAYIVRRVMDDAATMGETQTPTIYASTEGDAHLPRLDPGDRWAALFPNHARPPATADWSTLEVFGLPSATVERWANEMLELNGLQLRAINDHGVLDGNNVVVVAPTSSGKTLIGEIAAVQAASRGGRAVFLLPLKALVNDKYEAFTKTYAGELSVIRATGDHNDEIDLLLGGHYDLALLTYEKFTSLILGQRHIMRGVDIVVVDEAQMITDHGRGANLEFALTLLRRGYGTTAPCQIVALSGVTGDTAGLERWLNAELLRTDERPVPLVESVIDRNGSRIYRGPDSQSISEQDFVIAEFGSGSQSSKPYVTGLVRRLVDEGKKVIVFRNWKGKTVGTATYLSQALGLTPATEQLEALPTVDAGVSSATLRATLQGGVAFHNADLDPIERSVIEAGFRDRDSHLRVVVATTTLAMGINTPAEAVIIEGLDHGINAPYSVAEYKNMVGRAGRLGQVNAGESYLMSTDELDPVRAWNQYVNGTLEPIRSRLMEAGTDPQTILLRTLVALGGSATEDDLVALVESSFAAWQVQNGHPAVQAWDTSNLSGHLDELLAAGFLDRDPGNDIVLTALGVFAGESGIEVTSLVRLAHALTRAIAPLSAADLMALAQITVEVDNVRLRTHKKSVKERTRWFGFLANNGVQRAIIDSLHIGGENPIHRAKKCAAALYFASEVPIAESERQLMQHVQDNSAAGPIRNVASRTRDVLDAVTTVAVLRAGIECADVADDLAIRLEFGLPDAMVDLAKIYGTFLNRGQYLALHDAGLTDVAEIRAIDPSELERLIGPSAIDLESAITASSARER